MTKSEFDFLCDYSRQFSEVKVKTVISKEDFTAIIEGRDYKTLWNALLAVEGANWHAQIKGQWKDLCSSTSVY